MSTWRVGATAGVWLALTLVLWAAGGRPAVVALGGLVAAVAAALFLALDLVDVVTTVEWIRPHDGRVRTGAADRRVISLRNQLGRAQRYGSNELDDTLIELVDDRLLARHQVDRTSDPEVAATLLSPALHALVARSSGHPVTSVRRLRRILTDIEAL